MTDFPSFSCLRERLTLAGSGVDIQRHAVPTAAGHPDAGLSTLGREMVELWGRLAEFGWHRLTGDLLADRPPAQRLRERLGLTTSASKRRLPCLHLDGNRRLPNRTAPR